MTGIDRLLSDCLRLGADGRGDLALRGGLQGFPEVAHGGSVLAAFDLAAARRIDAATKARTIEARIQKSVPLGTALPLTAKPSGSEVALVLGEERRPLASGRVMISAGEPSPSWKGWRGPGEKSRGVPTSRGCLACGSENPLGLQVRLRFDDRWVWADYRPPETYRTSDGRLAPALYTVLLDEMAWWLGALASGEAGVTTEIAVTLHRPADPLDAALLALGPRDRVAGTDERGHFWKTETAILAPDGALLASATITFAGSRGYSRRLIPQLMTTNPAEILRPIFPAYVP